MNTEFSKIEVIEPRKDEQVLEEKETEVRRTIRNRGLQPIEEEEDTAFQLSVIPEQVGSREELEQYLESCRGYEMGQVAVYAEGRGKRGDEEVAEDVPVRTEFSDERFIQAYEALQEDFDVDKAGFNMSGYGENISEAFDSVTPIMSYMMQGDEFMTVTVSYRNGGMVESVWSEDQEFKKLYDALAGTGLGYEGAFMDGISDEEWMLAENGFEDLYYTR